MGADYFASDEGRFILVITNSHGVEVGRLRIDGLVSGEELYVDYMEGRRR